jgi:uncharacterized protein with PIN domain
LVDGMLGSLCRKLRAFGFDAEYVQGVNDQELLVQARRQNRVILTADRPLADLASKRGLVCIPMSRHGDSRRLAELLDRARTMGVGLEPGASRCSICNGALVATPKGRLKESVEPAILARHRRFFVCSRCGHVYWSGTHWKKLRRLRLRLWPQKNRRIHTGER